MLQNQKSPSGSPLVQYRNCRLLRDHKLVRDDLWVRDGKIQDPVVLFWQEKIKADVQIDCKGCIIAPGFIDVQINGGFGVDFSSSESLGGIEKVALNLLSHGVTSFCPTVITSQPHIYQEILPKLQQYQRCQSQCGATLLGIHLEGPFISKEKRGAHPVDLVLSYEDVGFEDVCRVYGSLDSVSIVTLAPEIPKSEEVVKELSRRGIKVSVGHSTANLKQAERAIKNGANFITHLFNAMLPFHHRDPGIVGLLASSKIPSEKTVFYGVIADGIHTHPAALRIAFKTHPNGVVLITDAIAAMGLQPGQHQFGSINIEVTEDRAYVAGTTTLAGSIATMIKCIKTFHKAARCLIEEAIEAATLHPAQMLGIEDQKGTLSYGADADFVFLNDDLDVLATFIKGHRLWDKSTGLREQVKGVRSSGAQAVARVCSTPLTDVL